MIELCPICIENSAEYYTECNHGYCIGCLSKIKRCALCRKNLIHSLVCVEILNSKKNKIKYNYSNYNYIQFNELTNNINVYSFYLEDNNLQPSGTMNFSRINNTILQI